MVYASIVFVVAAVALAAVRVTDRDGNRVSLWRFAAVPAALAVLLGSLSAVTVVDAGEVAVPVLFGEVKPTLGEGLQVHNPFARIVKMSVRDELYTAEQATAVSVRLSDGNTAPVEFTVRFALDPVEAGNVYRTQGPEYAAKLIVPQARETMRDVMGGIRADAIAENRRDIADAVETELRGLLAEDGLFIQSFELRNIDLPQSIDDAIEAKLQAEQRALQKEFELQSAEQDAEIARTRAEGEADANRILSASVADQGDAVLYLRYLETITAAWEAGNSVIYLPQETGSFNLNLPGTPAQTGQGDGTQPGG